MMILRLALCFALAITPAFTQAPVKRRAPMPRAISPDALRAHVSFLASDPMQGRNTPSPELDIAAEYIASQFRRIGLEEISTGGYFQVSEPEPETTPVAPELKNVIGILPGTHPKLREEYVILSAHYDHLGVRPGEGDQIFNGANDNASGVAGLIEAAAALKTSTVKPRRTVVFIAFSGEEKGLLGSKYYAAHPVFPIESTAANVNLEQLGRTDDTDGPRIAAAIITGYRFSEVPELLRKPMLAAGITLEENLKYGDAFFQASDNRSLAAVGVPAHTISLSFRFPDAHRPGDEWQKLDYDNMAKVTRGIAAGVLAIANRAQAPRWLTGNPKAQPYADKATLLSTPPEASAPKSGSSPASPKPRRSTP